MHWQHGLVMTPTLSSLIVTDVVVTTSSRPLPPVKTKLASWQLSAFTMPTPSSLVSLVAQEVVITTFFDIPSEDKGGGITTLFMVPTFSSMVAPQVVTTTTSGAASDKKVGSMAILGFNDANFPIIDGTGGCRQGTVSTERCRLTSTGIPMLKIRRSCDRIIFNMGIPLPGILLCL